jgi:integrase/recombinase XerD
MSPLRRRMIDDMQIRNLTPNTQRVYVAQIVRFACHFRKSPELLGPAEIRTYLIHLTQERRLAASSIIVTVSALRFFFTVTLKRPWIVEDDIPAGRQAKKLPVVLSQEEVACFLGAVDNLKHRVILTVCYATGLRISEAVRLKATAIDSKRMVIRVEQGKGRKDRYVMLPPNFSLCSGSIGSAPTPESGCFPAANPASRSRRSPSIEPAGR